MEFKEKIVAFIDILGFKNLVDKAENNELNLDMLLDYVSRLGNQKNKEFYKRSGPLICPCSNYISKSLDFEILQISDCVIISSEISPAGVINLLNDIWLKSMDLMNKGIMCRGYVTRGLIYHTNNQVIGSGYQDAYKGESAVTAFSRDNNERGTPFIEIDQKVVNYIKSDTDECVQEMFDRMTKTDSELAVTALFPFDRLVCSIPITDDFNIIKARLSIDKMKIMISSIRENISKYVDPSNERATKKLSYYIKELDHQSSECNKQYDLLERFNQPFLG